MSTTVGTWARPYEVYMRPCRTGWRRFLPSRPTRIGVVSLNLPVHAETTDDGDVQMRACGAGEIFRALGDGLRAMADEADVLAGGEARDE